MFEPIAVANRSIPALWKLPSVPKGGSSPMSDDMDKSIARRVRLARSAAVNSTRSSGVKPPRRYVALKVTVVACSAHWSLTMYLSCPQCCSAAPSRRR